MEYNALDVSRQIIFEYNSKNTAITNLKLQKILYFIQGMSYKAFAEPLFTEDIEAWKHGPVIPSVYSEYAYKGSYPLHIKEDKSNMFCDKAIALIKTGVNATLNLDPWYLVDLTHVPKSPWSKYYINGSKKIIPKDAIQEYFTTEHNNE